MDVYKLFKEGGSDYKELTHYVKEQLGSVEVLYRMGTGRPQQVGQSQRRGQDDG